MIKILRVVPLGIFVKISTPPNLMKIGTRGLSGMTNTNMDTVFYYHNIEPYFTLILIIIIMFAKNSFP